MARANRDLIGKHVVDNQVFWKLFNKVDRKSIITKLVRKIYGLNKFRITCVQIHITEKCNLDCMYCYAKKHRGPSLEFNKIIDLINESHKLGVHEIQFVGGEPFLYPNFKRLIMECVDLKLNISIYTNGTLVTDEWIEFLNKYKERIIVIFKLDSSEGYIQHLGTDLYADTIEVINKCNIKNIRTASFITVTRKNFKQIEKLIKISIDLSTIPIIERYLPVATEKINKELEITNKQWNFVLDLYTIYNKKNLPKYDMVAKLLNFYCSCYHSTISININGEALPCPYAPKELSLGNINKNSMKGILELYEEKLEEWNNTPEECLSCNHQKICNGGCRTYSFLKSGDINKKDPLCGGMPPNRTMCSFNHYLFK